MACVGDGKVGCPKEGDPLHMPPSFDADEPTFVLELREFAMALFSHEVVLLGEETMRRG